MSETFLELEHSSPNGLWGKGYIDKQKDAV